MVSWNQQGVLRRKDTDIFYWALSTIITSLVLNTTSKASEANNEHHYPLIDTMAFS